MADDKIELVQKFVDAFHNTQNALDERDREGAAASYKDMLGLYNQISSSNLDPMHKELAYDQLVKVYTALQNPQSHSMHATTHIVAAAVLLMLFSFLVFFKPAVFGLVTADAKTVQDVNWAFVDSGQRALRLDAAPSSLSISGKVDGAGFVRVYAVTGSQRALLFDNDLVRIADDGTFSAACVNTCGSALDSADVTLDVVVENAALTIYTVEYRK
jgi:hypothetical protein